MKILIVGVSGFIGQFLADRMVKQGYQVGGIDLKLPEDNGQYAFFQGNMMNPEDIMKAAKDTEIIIHLAAAHHDFGVSRQEFFRVNVGGTQNLINCASRLGIKKFIFFSTVAVYGNRNDCTSEQTQVNPASDYGESKLAAEQKVREWVSRDTSRSALVIRPVVVFGPKNYANMYKLLNNIHKMRFIPVGKGDNIKSVAYVENLVDAVVFLLKRMKPGLDIYNYSDYPQMTSAQIVSAMRGCLAKGNYKFSVPLKPALALTSVIDILAKVTGINFPITANRIRKINMVTWHGSDKIRRLGFKPQIELGQGFKRMVEWYLSNNNGYKTKMNSVRKL